MVVVSRKTTTLRARVSGGGGVSAGACFGEPGGGGTGEFSGRISRKFVIGCGFPFSNSSKSSFVSPVIGRPSLPVTTTSTLMTRTSIVSLKNVGCCWGKAGRARSSATTNFLTKDLRARLSFEKTLEVGTYGVVSGQLT